MNKTAARTFVLSVLFGLTLSVGLLDAASLVFNSHNDDPTSGKPQNKVWFAKGWWWAWLPHGDSGGRMWRRTGEEQWMPEEHLDLTLQLLPGRADIWAGENELVAALVEDSTLAMILMRWSDVDSRYEPVSIPLVWNERLPVETVTLARQADGAFWITYPVDSAGVRKVVARKAHADLRWPIGKPVVLDEAVAPDDICAIVEGESSVDIYWTDEKDQCFYRSSHTSGQPDSVWTAPEVALKGNKDPQDNPAFCRPSSASPNAPKLLIATRNSALENGKPVLGLMTFDHAGQVHKVPFAVMQKDAEPVQPLAAWVYGRPVVFYTVLGQAAQGFTVNRIMMQPFTPDGSQVQGEPSEVVQQAVGLGWPVSARVIQPGSPLMLLSSDNQGNVFETLIETQKKTGN
jgi:hypothetical protein